MQSSTVRKLLLCCLGVLSAAWTPAAFTSGQNPTSSRPTAIRAVAAPEPIRLDGLLSESCWINADSVSGFFLNFPVDTLMAKARTTVWITYDEHHIYIAARMYDVQQQDYVISSLRRDFEWEANDNFSVFLDTFADGQNGFGFAVSPFGVEREGLISWGRAFDESWDNRWHSAVKTYPDHWVTEIAIPLKTLRYREGVSKWKVNFARNNQATNEFSSWAPTPINFRIGDLAFAYDLEFDQPLPKPGANIAFIPYIAGQTAKRHTDGTPATRAANVGFDAKVGITPALNLDLTVNPDFSQVEVDQQVTNLDRFEIFFPERRQFFVENSDLFSSFGFSSIRPFFSRRIGIGRDSVTGLIKENPILYGARLSGKMGERWRVGLLNMQTAQDADAGIRAQNYTMATLQRQVFARSNVNAFLVNRQGFQNEGNPDYTRVAGMDYNLISRDSKWMGKFFYHRAFLPGSPQGADAHASFLRYDTRKWQIEWNHEYVGRGYQINDVGFVRRQAYWRLEPIAEYRMYPKKGPINRHGFWLYNSFYTDLSLELTDRQTWLSYFITFQNRSRLEVGWGSSFEKIVGRPFDPSGTGGRALQIGDKVHYEGWYMEYASDPRKLFNVQASLYTGEFYNGTRHNLNTTLNYRFQPYGQIGLNLEYNQISLPEGFNSANLWLLGTRLDVSFTRSLFLTTFLQYNNQLNNFNHNTRLQWRFRPVSDLFVVYTDNYFPDTFRVKNRALVLKLTYWLNV